MADWRLTWNFSKPSYSPGEQALVSYWIENVSESPLYLSNLQLEFDFGTYDFSSVGGMVSPRENRFLGNMWFQLPKNVVGRKFFTLRYHLHEFINNNWADIGSYASERQYFISIYHAPFCRIFVPRGLTIEDRAIGDPIAEVLREWGFQTVTIGIEVVVPEEQVTTRAREEIKQSEGVVAIATPRFMDALTGTWRTLEWLHNEIGIAYGVDKPLLILKDRRVTLGGLPSYLADQKKAPIVEFDPYNLNELGNGLSTVMPGFREWIETKRRQAFNESLGKLIVGGLAVVGFIAVINGIAGALSGSSKR